MICLRWTIFCLLWALFSYLSVEYKYMITVFDDIVEDISYINNF